MQKIILTGDRPTGRLHIGHYVGSLRNRIKIQNEGTETVTLTKGQRFAQGIFIEYKTVDDEDEITRERTGATGSTDKEE